MSKVKVRKPGTLSPGQMLLARKVSTADASAAGEGWRSLSATLTKSASRRIGRGGVTVLVSPGATKGLLGEEGAPPGFWMDAASRIVLDGSLLPESPEKLQPAINTGHFKALSSLHGVYIHETGHAAHTSPELFGDWEDEKPGVIDAGRSLEEIRMEARIVQTRPRDARFLRASARDLILDEPSVKRLSAAAAMGAEGVDRALAGAATLLEGRVRAGSLKAEDIAGAKAHWDKVLSPEQRKGLSEIWDEAVRLADDDLDGMKRLARRFNDLIPHPADESAAGGLPGAGKGDGGDSEALAKALQDAAEGLSGASDEANEELAGDESTAGEINRIGAETQARSEIEKSSEARGGQMPGAPGGADPKDGEREPTPEERSARNQLAKRFRRARWRDRTVTRRQRNLPPGRLRSREALRGDAERSLGKMVSARPWKQRQRRQVEMPKLTAAVLVDTSGSMCSVEDEISGALWVLSHAVHDNGGKVCGVTFGDAVELTLPPGEPPRWVQRFKGVGGTAGVPESLELVEENIALGDEEGPRLLVLVTDGYWCGGDDEIEALRSKGVKVMMIDVGHDPSPHPADEICVIEDMTDMPRVVGDAAEKMLRNAK